MPRHDFRGDARRAIARAKAILANRQEPEDLRYAALDVRMAMEALTYERAQRYDRELPESAYETWQPKKLMQMLLDIDPVADQSGSLRMGRQEAPGIPAKVMRDLGHETVLDLRTLRRHYDAIGNYLHTPTVKQLRAEEAQNFGSLKVRLDEIITFVDAVLNSRIFNISFGNFSTTDCQRCGKAMRWRIPRDAEKLEAQCRECSALYDLEVLDGNQVHWQPREVPVQCTNGDCREISYLWHDEVEPGIVFTCEACEHKSEIVLIVRPCSDPASID